VPEGGEPDDRHRGLNGDIVMRKIFVDVGPTRVACWSGCEFLWWGHEVIPIDPEKCDAIFANRWGDGWTQDDRDVPVEQEPPVDP
jgi:hypothetical protein